MAIRSEEPASIPGDIATEVGGTGTQATNRIPGVTDIRVVTPGPTALASIHGPTADPVFDLILLTLNHESRLKAALVFKTGGEDRPNLLVRESPFAESSFGRFREERFRPRQTDNLRVAIQRVFPELHRI